MTIKLTTIQDVQDFVRITNTIPGKVLAGQDEYTVDAKSIMGIFSLDLLKPICVYKSPIEHYFEELKQFEVK